MQKLFVDCVNGDILTLEGDAARHVAKSLRMQAGDMLTVTDGSGTDYGCMIKSVTRDAVTLEVCYQQAAQSEPTCHVTIYQGVPKGQKMEDIIQKCTEIGVSRIVPVLTERSVSRPDSARADKKSQRYNRIALEAAQQSGRGVVPVIDEQCTLAQAVAADNAKKKIVFYEGGGEHIADIVAPDDTDVSIYIGPEGGFGSDEIDILTAAGAVRATLGPRILRTQTAPVAALTAVMLLTGNM